MLARQGLAHSIATIEELWKPRSALAGASQPASWHGESVFLAEVHSARATEGMPLTYFRGKMGRFEFMSSGKTASLWRHMQWQDYD